MLLATAGSGCDGEIVDRDGAEMLWEAIHEVDYTRWDVAPGYETAQPTIRAHGITARVYVNPVMQAAAEGPASDTWPEGALLVKDSYDAADNPHLIAAMEKTPDGWFFAEWSAAGEVLYAGQPEVCLGCHLAGQDQVFSVPLPR
jgi:hypothetical protein